VQPGVDSFTDRAFAAAEAFARQNKSFTVRRDAPAFSQGCSHRVVRAWWRGEPVVFKYYAYGNDDCRLREANALRHFTETPCLPRLVDDRLERALIMTEIDGEPLTAYESAGNATTLSSIWRQIGGLIAHMSRIPLSDGDLDAAHRLAADDMACAWNAHAAQPDFGTPVFERSLRLQEKHMREGMAMPLCLCDRDLNPGNVLSNGSKLSGVVDLESCRPGTIAEQAGIALYAVAAYPFANASPELLWNAFCDGWSEVTMMPSLQAVRVQCHRKVWATIHRDGVIRTDAPAPDWYVAPDSARIEEILRRCDALMGDN